MSGGAAHTHSQQPTNCLYPGQARSNSRSVRVRKKERGKTHGPLRGETRAPFAYSMAASAYRRTVPAEFAHWVPISARPDPIAQFDRSATHKTHNEAHHQRLALSIALHVVVQIAPGCKRALDFLMISARTKHRVETKAPKISCIACILIHSVKSSYTLCQIFLHT